MEISGVSVTFELVIAFVLIAIFAIEAYNKIMAAVSTHRENVKTQGKPINDIKDRLKAHDDMLEEEERKIEILESQIASAKSMNNIEMRALLAIVRHEIDGNNINGLKDVREEIQNYLIDCQ